MAHSHSYDVFREALTGKQIPLLILDNRWHQLFNQAQVEVPAEIKRGEARLHELIKKQGKLNNQCKEARKMKKRAMEEIMKLSTEMGEQPNRRLEKLMEEKKKLIRQCNNTLDEYREEMRHLPEEIERVNNRLMLITMDICYRRIAENTKEIEAISSWMKDIRIQMKKNIVRKEESEQANFDLYSYMHHIFGAEVMEIFDMKYNPEERRRAHEERILRSKFFSHDK